jgi:hypothetical protein
VLPCASDQLNRYHKNGEVSSVSQTSPYGIFTAGIWYEWASTNRYLYPTNPFTRAFGSLPSYREYLCLGDSIDGRLNDRYRFFDWPRRNRATCRAQGLSLLSSFARGF